MSSLTRRTVRTTAAAAGIAALGAGLAGNAVAAPAADVEAPAPGPTSMLQGLPVAAPRADLPSAPGAPNLADLPMLFVFEGPTVNTAGPSSSPAPSVDVIANSQRVVGSDSDTNRQVSTDDASDAGRSPSTPARDGALSTLDTAGLFGGLDQERLVDQQGFDVNTQPGSGSD
jgi:hypothetical protein